MGHTKYECKKPKKEMSARACFRCGQEGHIAKNCPNQDGKAKALEQADAPRKTFLGCLGGSDFVPVHRQKNGQIQPLPEQETLPSRLSRGLEGALWQTALAVHLLD